MSLERFEFKQAMESLLPKAVGVLAEMLEAMLPSGEIDRSVRERGMHIVFDRTQGRVVERKELTGANGAAIQIEDSTPAIRLLLQQVMADEAPKVIEAEKSDDAGG